MVIRRVHDLDYWHHPETFQRELNHRLTNGERIVAILPKGTSAIVVTEDYGLGPLEKK